MARVPPLAAILLLATVTVGARGVPAQTLTGRVLEEGRETPIPGAVITLVDREGDRRAGTTADSLGRFTLAPPEPGQYAVVASRVGYRTTRSPLFALRTTGTSTFDILMSPEPVGLAGFEISVEREVTRGCPAYSEPSTSVGSTRVALRAGTYAATADATVTTTTTPTHVRGSRAPIP